MITREFEPPGDAGTGPEGDPFGYTDPPAERPAMSDVAQPGSMATGNPNWGIKRGNQVIGHAGLDPSNPNTFTRRWNPTTGLFRRLHEENEGHGNG